MIDKIFYIDYKPLRVVATLYREMETEVKYKVMTIYLLAR